MLVSKIAGFNTPKDFYTPAYEPGAASTGPVPDYRSTIFWAPMLKTDANGKVRFSYYNSDENTAVALRAEVLGTSGTPGYGIATYEVR